MRSRLLALSAVCWLAAPAVAQPPAPLPPATEAPIDAEAAAMENRMAAVLAADYPSGPRFWASAEYLRWWVTPMNTPELIQTVPGSVAAASVNSGTALPAGSTSTYFPSRSDAAFGGINGLRGTIGGATDTIGWDVSGFVLEQTNLSASLFSNGQPFAVAQQYFSTVTNLNTSLFSSLSGSYSGGTTATLGNRVWGFDGNVRIPTYRMLADYNHALVGFRYFDLMESLQVRSDLTFTNGATSFNQDDIRTRNQFYGGQVGLSSRYGGFERGLGLDGTIKLGLGSMRQRADLTGSNGFRLANGSSSVSAGGLYVQPSNDGYYERDRVAFLTEYDLNLTYNFSENVQIFFGYSIIYVSSVIRPGEAIDPVLNDSRISYIASNGTSNADRPVFTWNTNDFWTQGISFGVKLMY